MNNDNIRRCVTAPEDTYHHGDLPAALVSAARLLLAEPGAELSLREVARRAGVSNAAPYRHFAGLPALIDAVAADVFDDLATALESAAAQAASASEALRALAHEYVAFVVERPSEARIAFARPKAERSPGSPVEVAAGRAFAAVVAVMVRGQEAGEFSPGDAGQAAFTGWALIHGVAMLALSGQVDAAGDDARRSLVDGALVRLTVGLGAE